MNVSKEMQKLDKKNKRYQEFLARRGKGELTLWDQFKFRFESLANAGVTEIPNFTDMYDRRGKIKMDTELIGAIARLDPGLLETAKWLATMPEGESKEFLLNFNGSAAIGTKQVMSYQKIFEAVSQSVDTFSRGKDIEIAVENNIKHTYSRQKSGTSEYDMSFREKTEIDSQMVQIDRQLLEQVLLALIHAAYASSKSERKINISIFNNENNLNIAMSPGIAPQGINFLKNAAEQAGCTIEADGENTVLAFKLKRPRGTDF